MRVNQRPEPLILVTAFALLTTSAIHAQQTTRRAAPPSRAGSTSGSITLSEEDFSKRTPSLPIRLLPENPVAPAGRVSTASSGKKPVVLDSGSDSTVSQPIRLRLTNEMGEKIKSLESELIDAADAVTRYRGIEPASLTTREVVHERIALFQRLASSNEDLLVLYRRLPADLEEMAARSGATPEEQKQAVNAVLAQSRYRDLLECHKQFSIICDSAIRALEILEKHWGRWRYDPKQDTIVPDARFPDEDAIKYNASIKTFREAFATASRLLRAPHAATQAQE